MFEDPERGRKRRGKFGVMEIPNARPAVLLVMS